jgi:PhnB protein
VEGPHHVPPGGQAVTPYICPRDAAQALDWYRDVFGAEETTERFVDADGRIGHAEFAFGGAAIMVSDAYPDYGAVAPAEGNTTATFALNIYVPDADSTVARAEAAGAAVQRPVEEQFYGARMGTIVDPFGVRWMIGTHVRDVSKAELAAAAEQFSRAVADTREAG